MSASSKDLERGADQETRDHWRSIPNLASGHAERDRIEWRRDLESAKDLGVRRETEAAAPRNDRLAVDRAAVGGLDNRR